MAHLRPQHDEKPLSRQLQSDLSDFVERVLLQDLGTLRHHCRSCLRHNKLGSGESVASQC